MHRYLCQFLLFAAGSFVCLYLAFSPAANIPYTNHDSIRYFHQFYNSTDSEALPLYQTLYADGRPLAAEIEEFIFKSVHHLSDISRLRLMTIMVMAVNSGLLALIAVTAGMEMIPAFFLSVAIFTLPGAQEFIFVPYLPLALAITSVLLGYVALINPLPYKAHLVIAAVLVEAAFFIYQPLTLFFLLPAVLMVICSSGRQAWKTVVRDILWWAVPGAVYYLILRLFFYAQVKSSGHEIAFTWAQTVLFTGTFFTSGIPQIFNLWNIYYSASLGYTLLALITAVLILAIVLKQARWSQWGALIAIFCLLSLVWFLFGGFMPRQFIAAQACVVMMVYWAGLLILKICKVKEEILPRAWVVAMACAGLIMANHMITSNIMNNYSELMFIRSRLAQFVNSSTQEIHVIRLQDSSKGYNGLPAVYDNINSTTPDYEIPDLIRVALKDMGEPFDLHCIVTFSGYNQPFKLLPNAVVINMNDLAYISSPQLK